MMKLTLWCPLTSDFRYKTFSCVMGLRDVLTVLVSGSIGGQIQPCIGRRRAMICSCTGVRSRWRQVYQTSHHMYQLIDTLLINVLTHCEASWATRNVSSRTLNYSRCDVLGCTAKSASLTTARWDNGSLLT